MIIKPKRPIRPKADSVLRNICWILVGMLISNLPAIIKELRALF